VAALDLSAAAVKQRLSRGRGMLRERMAELVEGALRRSRPGRAFTVAVVTGLAALSAGARAALAGAGAAGAGPTAKAALGGAGSRAGPAACWDRWSACWVEGGVHGEETRPARSPGLGRRRQPGRWLPRAGLTTRGAGCGGPAGGRTR
jgi:hypothetical protein